MNLKNIHNCSTYQLRQELKRRGKFCTDEVSINHEILLKTMISVLVEERDQQVVAASVDPSICSCSIKKEREERKAEAIEANTARHREDILKQRKKPMQFCKRKMILEPQTIKKKTISMNYTHAV